MSYSTTQFDRALHQALPNPLALAYRKAFNSANAKELHDNAVHFGLCMTRLLAVIAAAYLRELQVVLSPEEMERIWKKKDQPSEGDWQELLRGCVAQARQRQCPASSVGALLDEFLLAKRSNTHSRLPDAVGLMRTYLEEKQITLVSTTADDFLGTLVRYRNKTMGHGVVLPEDLNRQQGQMVLDAVVELVAAVPLWDRWELKFVSQATLDNESVVCHFINLTGPDWLREPPASYPRGYPVPLRNHVVLHPRGSQGRDLDLHPLVLFRDGRFWFFEELRRRQVVYHHYDSNDRLRVEELAGDFAQWKSSLVRADSSDTPAPAYAADAPTGPAVEAIPPQATQRFRMDRLLGRGGMGEVWLGYDETLKRRVAIKRIRRELLGDADIYRRFLQEARDAAKLSHANIVPILSIDSDERGPYLVLEYMEGGSLRDRISAGKLALPEALAYLRQVLQALEFAHQQGVIHRDIKPENILLSKAGVPKLADFGLAWVLELEESDAAADADPDEGHQAPSASSRADEGTRAYIAPELKTGGERPSPRTDLYSLGVTFYQMLTALPPQPMREKKVPDSALPLWQKMSYANPNLRYDSAQAALSDCLELERALELTGRTQAETQERIARTVRQGQEHLAAGKTVDAQACFQRVLAEEPEHEGALAGMLLVYLINGDMPEAARRYEALLADGVEDPLFVRVREHFQSIPQPAQLVISAQPMPFSYLVEDLRQGRFVKDLVQYDRRALNLGDVGELLVELAQQSAASGSVDYESSSPERHVIKFGLTSLTVQAEYRLRIKPGLLLFPARLLGIELTLTIDGPPLETYRLSRYLAGQLVRRFKRPESTWIDRPLAEYFGHDADAALRGWQRLNLRFEQLVQQALA